MTSEEQRVLAFLKEYRELLQERFERLIIYGVKATELIRLIEQPEQVGRKPFVHVCKLYKAIDRIDGNLEAHRLAMYRDVSERAA